MLIEWDVVDQALVRLLEDELITKDIKLTFLELLALFGKEKKPIPTSVAAAAAKCALSHFSGELNDPTPAIVL